MDELLLSLERNHREIAKIIRQIMKVLEESDKRSAPEKYLAVIRGTQTIKAIWVRHMAAERALFPMMPASSLSPDCRDRVTRDNISIEKHLASFLAAPWPRSTPAGLHSVRTRAADVLMQVRSQIERERVTLLPGMLLLKRIERTGANTESAETELVQT